MTTAARVALMMQRCELLYLDQQFVSATKVYDFELEPFLEELSPECAALLADNRSIIATDSFDRERINRFYHEIDVRRLLGLELGDYRAAFEAEQDASVGRHHEALPTIWGLLITAYRNQNWRAMQWAHAQMARECTALGFHVEAAWHAVQSLDKPLVKTAAKHLAETRFIEPITTAIDKLMASSSLASHAISVAEFLCELADHIPDNKVAQIVEWAVPRLDANPTTTFRCWISEPCWTLIGRLAQRLDEVTALQLARLASSEESLKHKSIMRAHVIEAWSQMIARLGPQHLEQFVAPAVSLLTIYKSDSDFIESVNLVCHLGERSDSCRTALRSILFPPGAPVSNPVLMQVGALLGWRPTNVVQLNSNVSGLTAAIRKQVEVVAPGDEPSNIGAVSTLTKPEGSARVVVHIGGAEQWLNGMLAHLERLSDDSVGQIIRVVLEVLGNDRNAITNRIALVQSLQKLASRVTGDLVEQVAEVLWRIAVGQFNESDIGQTHQEANNPLNAFKLRLGSPLDLRGVALITLAIGSKQHVPWSARLHSGLLEDFLETSEEQMRWLGVVAAHQADRLTDIEATALITSALDGSVKVRKQVFVAISSPRFLMHNRQNLRFAARAVIRASNSIDAGERGCAAKAAKALLVQGEMDVELVARLRKITEQLTNDVSYYVRKSSTGGD